MILTAFDTETFPIGPGAVAPRIVCASFADEGSSRLVGSGDDLRGAIEDFLIEIVTGKRRAITHNGGYDAACVCATWPDLIPLVFEALESGNWTDTLWREKLLNLSTTGRLDVVPLPDGSTMDVDYSLAGLETAYLGIDRSAQKEGDDVWRVNYGMLDGLCADEYPDDARDYAVEDAESTLNVHNAQEARKRAAPYASTATEEYRLLTSFCLYLETAWGMATDREEIARVRAEVDGLLSRNRDLLLASGVVRGGSGPEPYAKQRDRALELLEEAGHRFDGVDWTPHQALLTDLGIRFKAPIEESVSEKRLQEVAAEAYHRIGAIPTLTAGKVGKDGVRVRGIKLGAEQTEMLAVHDPVIRQYHLRKSLSKLTSQQLPILESAPVIHFRYDALKETTRTSSYGNKKGRPGLFPAANGQQVPKSIEGGDLSVDVRRCYRPREGRVFFDVDLHCLELACVGQITHDLFGESVHLARYNAGYDLHAYLASGILLRTSVQGLEAEAQQELRYDGDPEKAYRNFVGFKKHVNFAPVYKKYRSLAKPIGLGFPGGIGPAKMVVLARGTYGVELTEERARELRETWRDVYPEMPRYFDWITSQRDYYNDLKDDEGRAIDLYWYATPMGAIRRGCTYCSAANGKSMQSPGAEAATAGNNAVVRACHDPSLGSVLLGARPIAFVHDQTVGETGLDPAVWHEQATEVSRLMIEAARVALPKVSMRTEALLTTTWTKSAEPTFDGSGRLIPWRPK